MITLRDKIRARFTRTAFIAGFVAVAVELIFLFGFPEQFSGRHNLLPMLCVIPAVWILWEFTRCPECDARFGSALNRIIGRRSDPKGPLNNCPHCGVSFDKQVPD